MQQKDKAFFRTGEFAQMAGVTIRALRHYDDIGLLHPSVRSESGYRLYSEEDLGRLQHIQTLKFIGLSLDEIQEIIKNNFTSLKRSLQAQRRTLDEKIRHLRKVVQAIEAAEESIQGESKPDWDKIINVVRAIKMEKNMKEWTNQFYTEEQQKFLEERAKNYSREQAVADGKKWAVLIEEVKKSLDKDPASPEVQDLAARWWDLVSQFTQGDPGLLDGLKKMYSRMDEMPEEYKPYGADVQEFMTKALKMSQGTVP